MAKKINTEWRNRIVSSGTMAASQFVANPSNWRIHPKAQREALSGVLNEVGWVQNVIVNKTTGNVVDGHARIEEALKRGDDTPVPYVEVELTEGEEQKILLTLDPISAMAAADKANLDALLKSVETQDAAVMAMIADMADKAGLDYGDSKPPVDAEPQIDKAEELRVKWGVELGQLWQLGDHRLLCGDSTKAEDVARVMGGEKADAVVTDPPYGMYLDTNFSGMNSKMFKGKTGGASYAPIIGDHQDYDPVPMLSIWDSKEVFLFGADYYAERLPNKNAGSWLVWDKRLDESADKMYGSCFELCWTKKPHKRDVIRVKWAGIFGMEKEDTESRVHPTQKPAELFRWIYERYTKAGHVIADPYSGSGTTIIACEQLGRKCRAIEISPAYVAVALQRWADATGKTPVLMTD